jgi:hypothetical protein
VLEVVAILTGFGPFEYGNLWKTVFLRYNYDERNSNFSFFEFILRQLNQIQRAMSVGSGTTRYSCLLGRVNSSIMALRGTRFHIRH